MSRKLPSTSFGRLSARRQLIAQAAGEELTDPNRVPITQLVGNPENPRESLGDLSELAHSIREHGLLQPLHVMPRRAYLKVHPEHEAAVGEADFVVINGNRRLAAAHQAGLETVPVYVRMPQGADYTEISLRAVVLAENLHRQDLAPLEKAQEIRKLLDLGLTRSQVAKLLGKSNGWVTQRLILIDLHPDLQKALAEGRLRLADARELGRRPPEEQLAMVEQDEKGGFYRVKSSQPSAQQPEPPGSTPSPTDSEGFYRVKSSKEGSPYEQLTLDLRWNTPENLADQVYQGLVAGGLSREECERFARAFMNHL